MKLTKTEEVMLMCEGFTIKTTMGSWILAGHSGELYVGGPTQIENLIKLLQVALAEPIKSESSQVKEV